LVTDIWQTSLTGIFGTTNALGPVWMVAGGYHTKKLALTRTTGKCLDRSHFLVATPKFWLANSDPRQRAGGTEAGDFLAKKLARPDLAWLTTGVIQTCP
jgi:hypothetical protein